MSNVSEFKFSVLAENIARITVKIKHQIIHGKKMFAIKSKVYFYTVGVKEKGYQSRCS